MAVQSTLNKAKIFHLLEKNAQRIREFGVAKLGLFGSYSQTVQSDTSDVDILVEIEEGKKLMIISLNWLSFWKKVYKKK